MNISFYKKYWMLARMYSTPGFLLLLLPCLFGVMLVDYTIHWALLVKFAFGALIMRAVGCIVNDLIDKDIDCHVERTKNRPIANKEISVFNAICFCVLLLFFGLLVFLSLNLTAKMLSLIFFICSFAYPYMKRIIKIPQIFLGIVFSSGALIGSAEVTDNIHIASVILYCGCVLWVIGYDTVYAYQDIKDDLQLNINSSAVYFKKRGGLFVYKCYSLACIFWFFAAFKCGMGYFVYFVILIVWLLLRDQALNTDYNSVDSCKRAFYNNANIGLLFFLGMIVSQLIV